MSECKYLYDFDYSCGHHTREQLDRQLTRDEYYLRVAGKCPACRAVTAEDDAALAAPKATRQDCDKKFTSDTPGAYVFVAKIGGDK